MAITLGTPASSAGGSDGTTRTLSFTVAAGDERVLVVLFATDTSGAQTVTNVTYAGSSLNLAIRAAAGGNKRSEIWYLVNPPVGTADIVATYSVDNYNSFGAIVLYGVRQSVPIDNVGSSAGAGTVSALIRTYKDNSLVLDIVSKDNSVVVGADQTEQWAVSYSFNEMQGSSQPTTTAGSQVISWTGAAGDYSQSIAAFAEGQGGNGAKLPNKSLRPAAFTPGIAR